MPRDYIDIGSAPAYEDCAQVGSPDYAQRARAECNRFIDLIRRVVGPEPEGARLAVKSNPHDFGPYYEVVCYYDTDNEEASRYAYRCEGEAPATWDGPRALPLAGSGQPPDLIGGNAEGAANAPPQPPGNTEEELRRDQIAYLPQLPKCDLCDKTAEYDARTKSGPWAHLCPDHWSSETYGQLGTGYGQKLIVKGGSPQVEPGQPDRVCDSCLAWAREDGIPDQKSQAFLMMEMGSEVADHLCDQVEDPNLPYKCLCGCRSSRR
jgi:hypothetical protein